MAEINSSNMTGSRNVTKARRRSRCGPKIVHLLIYCSDECTNRGLHWIDKDLGILVLPWPRQGTSSWDREYSKFFKDWNKIKNGNCTNGVNYPLLKTRVRTALNKIKSVKLLQKNKNSVTIQILNIKEERHDMQQSRFDYSSAMAKQDESSLLPSEDSVNVSQQIDNFLRLNSMGSEQQNDLSENVQENIPDWTFNYLDLDESGFLAEQFLVTMDQFQEENVLENLVPRLD